MTHPVLSRIPILKKFVDERFLDHRRRSSSIAGFTGYGRPDTDLCGGEDVDLYVAALSRLKPETFRSRKEKYPCAWQEET